MGQIHQQAEIVVGGAHVRCKPGCIGSWSHKGCLVHVKVKNLQLHHHSLGCGMVAHSPGCLKKLGICLVLCPGFPFSCQERNSLCSHVLCLVYGIQENRLRLFSAFLIQVIGVKLWSQKTGLCAVAHLHMSLGQHIPYLVLCLLVLNVGNLQGGKVFVAADGLNGIQDWIIYRRMGHPLYGSYLKIFLDWVFHNYIPPYFCLQILFYTAPITSCYISLYQMQVLPRQVLVTPAPRPGSGYVLHLLSPLAEVRPSRASPQSLQQAGPSH